jgi:polysaccharide export outer membrane protein
MNIRFLLQRIMKLMEKLHGINSLVSCCFRRQTGVAILLIAVITLMLAGCQTSPQRPTDDPKSHLSSPGTADYATNLLQQGDVVSITFQYSTNFNTTQKITIDGLLNLESVGQVKAAGTTAIELQAELAKLYKPQIKDDVVTVKLLAAASSVYVAGAVFKPGKIPMDRPLTVLEAVIEAGGYDPNRANLSGVTVLRITGGKQRTYHVNLKVVLQGQAEEPFYLRPFDIVNVPMKTFNF